MSDTPALPSRLDRPEPYNSAPRFRRSQDRRIFLRSPIPFSSPTASGEFSSKPLRHFPWSFAPSVDRSSCRRRLFRLGPQEEYRVNRECVPRSHSRVLRLEHVRASDRTQPPRVRSPLCRRVLSSLCASLALMREPVKGKSRARPNKWNTLETKSPVCYQLFPLLLFSTRKG